MSIPSYPDTFRLPEWDPYGMELNAGLSRSPMDSGYTRQRRRFDTLQTRIRMVIAMPWADLQAWQAWWNAYGFSWFVMPAVSGFTAPLGVTNCAPHVLRCISNITVDSAPVADWCRVSFEVELSPGMLVGVPEGRGTGPGAGASVGPTPPANPSDGNLWYSTVDPIGLHTFVVDESGNGSWVYSVEFPPGTHVGATAPADPEQGQLWYKTVEPVGLFIWYVDANSSQWVQIGAGGSAGMLGNTPLGTVSYFASTNPPPGWLLCNGQAVTAAYPELRAYLLAASSPFGLTGADPRVPDLRGEFIRGHDQGRGVDAGRVFGSSQLDQLQSFSGFANNVQTFGGPEQTNGIMRRGAPVNSAIWQGATAVARDVRITIDTALDPTIRAGAETRPRNVALLPCIKAFDVAHAVGQAVFNIATDAQVRQGTSVDTLLTPANVRALSGEQTLAATGQTQLMFDQVPAQANEFDLLLGINYPANGVATFDFAGAPLATCNWTRQLNAAAYAAPTGEAAVASMQIDTDTAARALTGAIKFVRDVIGGVWRAHGNYRRNATSLIIFHGSFFMNGELVALPRLNCPQGGGFAGGNATVRWRI